MNNIGKLQGVYVCVCGYAVYTHISKGYLISKNKLEIVDILKLSGENMLSCYVMNYYCNTCILPSQWPAKCRKCCQAKVGCYSFSEQKIPLNWAAIEFSGIPNTHITI